MKLRIALPGLVALAAARAEAQVDYRNLDDDRPVPVEDAYPVERYAFELLAAWRVERLGLGRVRYLVVPELEYGITSGTSLGVKVPLALTTQAGSSDYGLAGLRVFALVNLTTERPSLPGLGLRLDAGLPWGALAGSGAAAMVQALATRSFGRNRVHLNAGAALGSPGAGGAAEAIPRWRAGGAVDRTLLRSSTLLLLALTMEQEARGRGVEIAGAVGCRRQVTPTLVLDAGVSYAVVRDARPVAGITLGLSHAFGIAALLPGGGK
ncbi:MAG TPA: hypothetical protein VGQ17_16625 [Gemmatimonadales bacterium]|jgi:hypothetical protein|nr:hypothetical protein [Gemmatimonadales bacterium]